MLLHHDKPLLVSFVSRHGIRPAILSLLRIILILSLTTTNLITSIPTVSAASLEGDQQPSLPGSERVLETALISTSPSFHASENFPEDSQVTTPVTSTEIFTETALLPALPSGADPVQPKIDPKLETGSRLLEVRAEPPFITAGDQVTVFWNLDNRTVDLSGLLIQIAVPIGFAPAGNFEGSFDPGAGILSIPLDASHGHVRLAVPEDSKKPLLVTVSLFQDRLLTAKEAVRLDDEGKTSISSAGGRAVGLNGRVSVTFPPGAADEPLDVLIRNLDPNLYPPSLPGTGPFEIRAVGKNSKQEKHQFQNPITIEVAYEGEGWPTLDYYDPALNEWISLPTEVDKEAHVLRARSDHLTDLQVNLGNWQLARQPNLEASQVSPFTGAATHTIPLRVPAGPGGLQPALELAYNSQVVEDAIAPLTQASWVGMGWSLDVGSIERDMRGTDDDFGDDTFRMTMGDISSMLIKDVDRYYHLDEENFWRIQFTDNSWILWDQEGNKYTFGKDDASRAYHRVFPDCQQNPSGDQATWRWSLAEIENKFHQKLTFTHFKDTQSKQSPCNVLINTDIDVATYPAWILYPNGRTAVHFALGNRTDYKQNWTLPPSRTFYERYSLARVEVTTDYPNLNPANT